MNDSQFMSDKTLAPNYQELRNQYGGIYKVPGIGRMVAYFKWASHTYGALFVLLVIIIYGMQGLREYTQMAVTYVLKDEFGVAAGNNQILKTWSRIPWNFKFLYGLVFDNVPILRLHGKPWLLFSTTLVLVGYAGIAFPEISSNVDLVAVFLTMLEWGGACSDVLVDSLVIRFSRNTEYGSADLQSLSWISLSVGAILGYLVGGPLSEGSPRLWLALNIAFPLVVYPFVLLLKEPKSDFVLNFRNIWLQFVTLIKAFFAPPFLVLKTQLWIFISKAVVFILSDGVRYYLVPITVLSIADATVYVGLFLGTLIYVRYLRNIAFRKIFAIATIILTFMSFMEWILVSGLSRSIGIPDVVFIFGFDIISELFSRFKDMPFLVMAAQLCPEHMEATFFALLMSLSNTSTTLALLFGGELMKAYNINETNFEGLDTLILYRTLATFLPMFLLWLVPNTTSMLTEHQRLGHGEKLQSEEELDV